MRVCARAPTSSGARSPHPDARWTRASSPGRCQHDSAEVVVVPAVEDIDVLVAAARVDSVMMEQRRQVRTSAHSIPAQACSSNARSHLESLLRLELRSHYRTTFTSLTVTRAAACRALGSAPSALVGSSDLDLRSVAWGTQTVAGRRPGEHGERHLRRAGEHRVRLQVY